MKQGWEIKKLGEVCEMYQPKTISTKEMVDDGLYTVFGANGIIGKYDKYNHEEPQLLITCRGATCGSVLKKLYGVRREIYRGLDLTNVVGRYPKPDH